MGLFKSSPVARSFKFKTQVPNTQAYIGRTVQIEGKPVVIKTIVGNIQKPAFYEINGEHLIGMLRFHAQMEGDKSITEAQFQQFENMEMTAERVGADKKKIMGET